MRTLLLTENVMKASFIKNGLQYENFSCDIVDLKSSQKEIEQRTLQAQAVFVHVLSFTMLEEIIDYCLHFRGNLPIIVLAYHLHLRLFELLLNKGKIKNFFVNPFPFRLMAAEMRSLVFSEREKIGKNMLQLRDLQLDRETHEIKMNGKFVYLRNKEFALLEFLMLHEGKVLSREIILENVWDRNANIFTNTVDVHINKLRKKLHLKGKFIRTIPCGGYLIA